MITFKQFIRESRTKKATVEEIIEWADEHCRHYLEGKHFLYRGGSGKGPSLMLGDSVNLANPRKSANTNNNYTLWMDNHPDFEGWPKRSQSWIATSHWHVAQGFGGVSILIVEDNAKVGIVGEDDLWFKEPYPGLTLEQWAGSMEEILQHFGKGNNQTYAELKKALQSVTADMLSDAVDESSDPHYSLREISSIMNHTGSDTLYDFWDEYLQAGLFEQTNGANVSDIDPDGEVWIEGKVAFIPFDMSDLTSDERAALAQWSDKYPNFQKNLIKNWNRGHG